MKGYLFLVLLLLLAIPVQAGWECTAFGQTIPHGSRAGTTCESGCCVICVGSYSTECKKQPLCNCKNPQPQQCTDAIDTNCDGTVSNIELAIYANKWYTNAGVTNLQLALAAQNWYNG